MLMLIVLTLTSLILRLINLGDFPANISPQELILIYPLRQLLNYNLFLARLPFVLIYTLTIPLTVMLVRKVSPRVGWWSGVLLLISPWHLAVSRRAELPWQSWLNLDLSKSLERFFDFLSPGYLFLSGLLLSITLPLLLTALATTKKLDRLFWIAVKFIIGGTVLASLQVYFGNTQALIIALFGWTMLLGWGIAHSLSRFPGLTWLFLPIFLYQSVNSIHNYFIHTQKLSQSQWEVVYHPVADYIVDHQAGYGRVVIIPKYGFPREYLDWYSRGRIDQDKLVVDQYVDQYKDAYLDPGTLYIGHINEQIKHQVLATFQLPTGSILLFAGSGPSQAKY